MGMACHKQLRKIRNFSLGVYVYYILKHKEIHSLPQSKMYLLLPESLRNLVQFVVQSIDFSLTVLDKVGEALKRANLIVIFSSNAF
jgi:hypothetical protein